MPPPLDGRPSALGLGSQDLVPSLLAWPGPLTSEFEIHGLLTSSALSPPTRACLCGFFVAFPTVSEQPVPSPELRTLSLCHMERARAQGAGPGAEELALNSFARQVIPSKSLHKRSDWW